LILFDLDGTLIDSNGVWLDVDIKFLARRGKPLTTEYTDFVSHSIFPTAAKFTKEYYNLPESEIEIMSEWHELAREAYQFHVPIKPGVIPYLEQCYQKGEKMVLFTASVPELGNAAIRRLGIERYFSSVIFAQEIGLEKRNPAAFLRVAQFLNVTPSCCTMFDDAPHNCSAARAAGMRVVGVYDRFYEDFQEQVRRNSDCYINSFHDLLDA